MHRKVNSNAHVVIFTILADTLTGRLRSMLPAWTNNEKLLARLSIEQPAARGCRESLFLRTAHLEVIARVI